MAQTNAPTAAAPGSNLSQPPERIAVLQAGQKAISKSKPIIKPAPKAQTVKNSAPEVSRPEARAANSNAQRNVARTPRAIIPACLVKYRAFRRLFNSC